MTTGFKMLKGVKSRIPLNILIESLDQPPGDCEEFDVGHCVGVLVINILINDIIVGKFCLK